MIYLNNRKNYRAQVLTLKLFCELVLFKHVCWGSNNCWIDGGRAVALLKDIIIILQIIITFGLAYKFWRINYEPTRPQASVGKVFIYNPIDNESKTNLEPVIDATKGSENPQSEPDLTFNVSEIVEFITEDWYRNIM